MKSYKWRFLLNKTEIKHSGVGLRIVIHGQHLHQLNPSNKVLPNLGDMCIATVALYLGGKEINACVIPRQDQLKLESTAILTYIGKMLEGRSHTWGKRAVSVNPRKIRTLKEATGYSQISDSRCVIHTKMSSTFFEGGCGFKCKATCRWQMLKTW